jgi:hypothetical protein
LFSAEADIVRNEVWSIDIPEKVREDIDDPLAQELVIDVCLLLIDVINLKSVMALTFPFLFFQLLELDADKRLKFRDIAQHPFFIRT